MTLPDYPSTTVNWDTGLTGEMLRALGHLTVVSAQAEELLHQIYWHHAGLDERSGPIVTDNFNPKRLEEDITKLAALDKSNANILADLKVLFAEFRTLNTKRNRWFHWIWLPPDRDVPRPLTVLDKVPGFRLKRPVYSQKGLEMQDFQTADVQNCCNDFAWLTYRLRSHTFTDEQLREKRSGYQDQPPLNGISFADLFWPAPWLDKPLPPENPASGGLR